MRIDGKFLPPDEMARIRGTLDALTSIAQLCEIQGDYAGAIAAAEEEIAVLASDWDTTSGETVDQHLRKIEKLKRKL